VNGLAESWVLTDGDDQALDGSDDRWEREDTSGLVLLTSPVAVLEKRVEDSTKTERRFNDVGYEFSHYTISPLALHLWPKRLTVLGDGDRVDLEEIRGNSVRLSIRALDVRSTVISYALSV
jgi:hypothetical protein